MNRISEEVEAYSQSLRDLGIVHEILDHPESSAIPEVAEYLGITLTDTLPTMIMKAGENFIAIIRRGDCRLDFKKIKASVSKNIRMATPEEFTELTGLPLGAARVYNPGMKTYMDEKLFSNKELVGGSGAFNCSIRYETGTLNKLPDSYVVDITQD
jgi:prolyl-tRNA editing enzyme YbaK/EbsC (Cys-tRNA(Pro) deacylase)